MDPIKNRIMHEQIQNHTYLCNYYVKRPEIIVEHKTPKVCKNQVIYRHNYSFPYQDIPWETPEHSYQYGLTGMDGQQYEYSWKQRDKNNYNWRHGIIDTTPKEIVPWYSDKAVNPKFVPEYPPITYKGNMQKSIPWELTGMWPNQKPVDRRLDRIDRLSGI